MEYPPPPPSIFFINLCTFPPMAQFTQFYEMLSIFIYFHPIHGVQSLQIDHIKQCPSIVPPQQFFSNVQKIEFCAHKLNLERLQLASSGNAHLPITLSNLASANSNLILARK